MAANEQVLTAVFRARDEMSQALAKPQAAVKQLGEGFKQTQQAATKSFGEVGKQLKSVSASFAILDQSATRAMAKTANMANRLIGIAVAAQGLGGKDGKLAAATDALTTFAGIAVALPGPVGLGVGALAGLAVAFMRLTESQREAAEQMREFRAEMVQMERELYEARGQFLGKILTSKNPALAQTEHEMESIKRQIGSAYGRLAEAQVEMNANRGKPLSEAFLKAKESALDAQEQIDELTGKLKGLQAESDRLTVAEKIKALGDESEIVHGKVMQGIVTPAEAAEERLRGLEAAIVDLLRAQKSMGSIEFAEKMDELSAAADKERAIIEQARRDKEAQSADERKQTEERRRAEERALKGLENQWGTALPQAVETYLDSLKTVKDFTLDLFRGMEGAFSSAIEGILSGGQKMKSVFKALASDLKKTFLRTISQGLSQQLMAGLVGGVGALFGMGGPASAAVPTAQGSGSTGAASSGGVNLSSLGSGLSGLASGEGTAALLGLGMAGAAIGAGGVKSGNMGQSIGGMAMAGMSIGALAGPIGAVAGLAIGAIAGAVMGSRAKRREKRARRRAAYLAAIQYQQALDRARVVLKKDIRNKMGGGLATQDAASDYGRLLSGDLSASEIESFGSPEAIAARANEVNRQTNVNVGGITVQATIAGSYDVARLAEELSYHLQNQAGTAGGP
jgi:hypothetical protein